MNDSKIIFEGKLEVPKELSSIMTKAEIRNMVINKIIRKVDRLDIVAIDDAGKETNLLSKIKEK